MTLRRLPDRHVLIAHAQQEKASNNIRLLPDHPVLIAYAQREIGPIILEKNICTAVQWKGYSG